MRLRELAGHPLVLMLVLLAGSAAIYLCGYTLGRDVSAQAARWLGSAFVATAWAGFQWFSGALHEAPAIIVGLGLVVTVGIALRAAYLLLP